MLLSNTTAATASASSADTTAKMMTKCHRIQHRCRQMQYHNGASLLPPSWPFSFAATTSSFYGLNKWLWTALLFGLLIVAASATDENSKSSPASTVSSSLSTRDEIYIDDEGLDGSGRGGIHDDLEKDHDFSGSGFGPDDEDSDSDYHHNTHKHQTDNKTNNNNNNERNEGKIISPPIQQHKDDDDFDIEEAEVGGGSILVGSGDGGFIDRNSDNDDDDHTGDIDEDGDEGGDELPDITKYPKHGIFDSDTATKTDREHSTSHDGDDFEEETDHIDKHQPIDHDNDNEDENDDEDDDSDDVSVHKTHSEDGTEIYTDITDESSTGLSSSTTEKRPGGINTQGGTNIHDLDTNSINSLPPETKIIEQTTGNEVLIMNANDDDRTASFFAQPGILAAVIGGAVVGLLCAILVVMFIVYRMRKKDEGSYALDEPKRSPAMNSYAKNATNREFYA